MQNEIFALDLFVFNREAHRILFRGILGAIIMRAVCIFAGIALINRFHRIVIFFGLFLLFTGIRMITHLYFQHSGDTWIAVLYSIRHKEE